MQPSPRRPASELAEEKESNPESLDFFQEVEGSCLVAARVCHGLIRGRVPVAAVPSAGAVSNFFG